MLSDDAKRTLLNAQRNEITEHLIYGRLSRSAKEEHNRALLRHISGDELRHYNFWKRYTKQDVKPDLLKFWKYAAISKVLGLTFGLKLMESGENSAQSSYGLLSKSIPLAKKVKADEENHEHNLINMIDEEKLKYVGAIVLGLNDALVELTGAMAGFTFALQPKFDI